MDFDDILAQIERPYWSPVHPSRYIKNKIGWGLVYPQDIGSFNLMWLVSGCGLPPDSYERYAKQCRHAAELGYYLTPDRRGYIKDAAALMPIGRFADMLITCPQSQLAPLLDALRLRV